jgi:hypothetical protein
LYKFEYEKVNNVKFDIIVRSRFDLMFTQPLHLVKFFDTVDNELLNTYGEEIYMRSLGNENMAKVLKNNKIVKFLEYNPPIVTELQIDPTNTLNKINNNKIMWTFYYNWIWVAKRNTMDIIYPFVYFYGNSITNKSHYFSSEDQFCNYLRSHNCELFHFFNQEEWDLWTKHELHNYATLLDDLSLNSEIDKTYTIATILRR